MPLNQTRRLKLVMASFQSLEADLHRIQKQIVSNYEEFHARLQILLAELKEIKGSVDDVSRLTMDCRDEIALIRNGEEEEDMTSDSEDEEGEDISLGSEDSVTDDEDEL